MKKNVTKVFAKFLFLFFCIIYPCTIKAQDNGQNQYVVTATKLNVRSGPSANSKIVGGLSKGETAEVYSINNGWANIDYKGTNAYISAKYIEKNVFRSHRGIYDVGQFQLFISVDFNKCAAYRL